MTNRYIYLAEFRCGHAALYKAQVKKETPKTYVLTGEGEHVIGQLIFGVCRVLKSDKVLRSFEDKSDAIVYLSQRAEQHTEQCKDKLSKATFQADNLFALLREEQANERNQKQVNPRS